MINWYVPTESEPSAEKFPFRYDETLLHELAPYLQRGPLTRIEQAFKRLFDIIVAASIPPVIWLTRFSDLPE